MDKYIYYCTGCNKSFKVGGIGKKIRCPKCTKQLLDLSITSKDYDLLNNEAKDELKRKAATPIEASENMYNSNTLPAVGDDADEKNIKSMQTDTAVVPASPTKGMQLADLEQTDITAWDFERIKEELAKALSVYETSVYTDETIKLAKEDKAKLAKLKKAVEDQRKAFKAKCLEPYNALEPQVKELVSMIEDQRVAIDDVIKEYTERNKTQKESEIRAYYDKKAHVLGEFAAPLYDKILDPKWLNSSSGTKYREEMQYKITAVLEDIDKIKSINSPFIDTILKKYIETLSVDEAMAKHEELTVAASKAGLEKQQPQATVSAPVQEQQIVVDGDNGVLVRMYGKQYQIEQVMDFARAIGVRTEIQ